MEQDVHLDMALLQFTLDAVKIGCVKVISLIVDDYRGGWVHRLTDHSTLSYSPAAWAKASPPRPFSRETLSLSELASLSFKDIVQLSSCSSYGAEKQSLEKCTARRTQEVQAGEGGKETCRCNAGALYVGGEKV